MELLGHENQTIDATAIEGNTALLAATQLIQKMCLCLVKRAQDKGYQVPQPLPAPEGHKKTLEGVVKEAFTLLETVKDIKDLEYERLMLESILNDYVDTEDSIKERKKKGEGRC